MASIYFVGTYPPIMCGIATYTKSLTRKCPNGRWGVISFDLEGYGGPRTDNEDVASDPVWYGIPGRTEYSADIILEGLRALGGSRVDSVLWFQHEKGIWADDRKFVSMVANLKVPTVVTFHTLHFQSDETGWGLRRSEYELLRHLLPHVDAATVFSYGVYLAVISAFPEYSSKVFVTKHGVHSYADLTEWSRREARICLHEYLMGHADIDPDIKKAMQEEQVFLDPDAFILGQTGFLCPLKHSESLFVIREALQKMVPDRRIVAVRIGGPREATHKVYARQISSQVDWKDTFLLETWLPENLLPVAQRAFDVNFYWPRECTQSGIVAHALGAGAVIAGRELEGLGETLREAGEILDSDLANLTLKIRDLVFHPELGKWIEESALSYARTFSWQNQARRHYELIDVVLYAVPLWGRPDSSLKAGGVSSLPPCGTEIPDHAGQGSVRPGWQERPMREPSLTFGFRARLGKAFHLTTFRSGSVARRDFCHPEDERQFPDIPPKYLYKSDSGQEEEASESK